ncbi:DNA-binding transcriptional response regulator, NtrC family, contains REC, AAA-type ATPase, and a Fis-type DNA-binding domains [Persephonella hydrogeniphila]|uniref:DNA-binding transcriptional response regulator, NtrC family, contains REC, AAA-type ATPase, and a Fis-type DNA-binding domains n=1 Tax=Persephonella hydrogeniphila TaxID=198703 RepID=A0A285N521_9AQUI|nr:sigma-54 dependent transcriptional regulator [Persephonella hydrogeniphila]SNZ03937.1 DNA-binding transcriptional response regulator, NtrC family, contains REC, AAA-type ATPase, and a Fis-type DNA-binding domains [Persephonella hydrogeniphila]
MEKGRIMIVDDEEDILQSFQVILEEEGYSVKTVSDAKEALNILKNEDFDLVLSDMRMPGMTGEEFLIELRKFNKITSFIVMTAYGTIENAVKCMKEGAFHYITKPVNFNDPTVWKLIEEAVEKAKILKENIKLKTELNTMKSDIKFIITNNSAMFNVIEFIKKVAPFDNTVLIYGESGVGKELVARAIHQLSRRKDKPFIAVNCANLSRELVEAELFGYKKGAFTGATQDRKGILEKANGGTVFLDEIGEIPFDMQAKLLRFLEEKEIRRVGDDRPIKVDVRIIAATNRNLKKMIEEGNFRDDLYYRIAGFKIEIPPLRERKDDIPLLINHFIEKYNQKYQKNIRGIKPEALRLLVSYDWPGNVRQLESVISKAIILADDGEFIEENHLDPEIKVSEEKFPFEYSKAKKSYMERFMKTYLGVILSITGGNISQAAKLAKIERQSLQKLLRKHNIDPSKYRKQA